MVKEITAATMTQYGSGQGGLKEITTSNMIRRGKKGRHNEPKLPLKSFSNEANKLSVRLPIQART